MRLAQNHSPIGAALTCLAATALLCLVLLYTTGCTIQNPPPPVRFATPTSTK